MKSTLYLIMLMLPILISAQNTSELAIAGKANTQVKPDITIINLTISTLQTDYNQAMEALQNKLDETKQFLKKNNICKEDISSENFSINKRFAYEHSKQVFKGYQATSTIKIKFHKDLKGANSLLNAIGRASSDAEVNIWHEISPTLQERVNDELIKTAIADAKHKATIIAHSTGQQIGSIQKISYGVQENVSVHPQIDYKRMALSADKGNSNNINIQPELIHKSTEIIIYWTLEQ